MIELTLSLLLILTAAYDPFFPSMDKAEAPSQVEVNAANVETQSTVPSQQDRFIPVDGADLRRKMETALRLARSADSKKGFWTAYSFDVRPGVTVDAEIIGSDGSRTFVQGSSVSFVAQTETRNLGIFLFREAG